MRFGNLHAMHLLWLMAALVLFLFWSHRKRSRDMERFAGKAVLDDLITSLDMKRRRIGIVLRVASISLLIIALMRPQWGFELKEVKRSGLDIMIAIDTSNSMLAEDIKPNRLERSKLAVKDLIRKLHGDRLGLIAFAGSAFVQCPLTSDYSGFMLALDEIDTNTIPTGGTSIAEAIRLALDSFEGGKKKYGVLVLITDGEDHEGEVDAWTEKAKERGVKIYTIGIGTKDGELIPVTGDTGRKEFLKDRSGNVVKTRLDEDVLQKIALTTGGSYVKATSSEFGLDLLFDEKLSRLEKSDLEEKMVRKYHEKFQIPLALALLILIAELFVRERRTKDKRPAAGRGMLSLALLFILTMSTSASASPASAVSEGNKLYDQKKYEEAEKKYSEAAAAVPESDIANYNLGASLYKQGKYQEAVNAFTKAALTKDRELEAKTAYNIANSKYRLGNAQEETEPEDASGVYRESLSYYDRALELDKNDKDAKYNRDIVQKRLNALLEKLKNQPQQQEQDKKKNGKEGREQKKGEKGRQGKQGEKQQQQSSSSSAKGGKDKGKNNDKEGAAQKEEGSGEQKELGAKGRKMTPEEARLLLDAYKDEESVKLNDKDRKAQHPEVLKDW